MQRSEIRTDYLRKKFHLDNRMLFCPIIQEPFLFEIDSISSEDLMFSVTSPLHLLDEPYTESRFGVFTFEAGDHGFVRGGQKSWSE